MNTKASLQFKNSSATLATAENERQQAIARQVVSAVSRGNTNLQVGNYITARDKEKMRAAVLSYVIKADI